MPNTEWGKWIEQTNEIQHQWALRFLSKNGIQIFESPHDNHPFAALTSTLDHIAPSQETEKILERMRAAWTQKKYRDRHNNKKSYNFVMSLETKIHLNRIAKHANKTISLALEEMILEAGQHIEKLTERSKKELELLKDELKRKDLKTHKLDLVRVKRIKNSLGLANQRLTEFADEQISELSKYQALLKNENLTQLTPEAEADAQARYAQKKIQLNAINKSLNFIRSN